MIYRGASPIPCPPPCMSQGVSPSTTNTADFPQSAPARSLGRGESIPSIPLRMLTPSRSSSVDQKRRMMVLGRGPPFLCGGKKGVSVSARGHRLWPPLDSSRPGKLAFCESCGAYGVLTVKGPCLVAPPKSNPNSPPTSLLPLSRNEMTIELPNCKVLTVSENKARICIGPA